MPNRKVQVPKLSLRADFAPETINKEARSVEIVWTTGAKGLRSSWFGSPWYEELSLDPAHVNMGRLQSGAAPLLNAHSSYDLSDVIGVVERAWLKGNEGRAVVRFADTPDVADIWAKVEQGILRNISVGYRVNTYQEQPEVEGEDYPTFLATDWEPQELSVVPIGFDQDARIRAQDDKSGGAPCEFVRRNNPHQNHEEDGNMPENKTTEGQQGQASAATPAIDVEAAKREAAAAERRRAAEIRTACRAAGMTDEFTARLCEGDTAVDQARALIIDELAKRDAAKPQTTSHVRVEIGQQEESETRRAAIESALLHRFSQKNELSEAGRTYRGMSLLRIAEELVGPRARGMARSEIAQRALTTADFPLLLANIARKTLRDGYQIAPQTFWPIVRRGTLPDYKAMSRVQFGDAPSLEPVNEDGEYLMGSIGEAAEQIKLAKFGKKILITEETIINDDLDAFSRLPQMMGSAASRLESNLVWGVFTGNPVMADNVTLFHANHNNLGSASAINATSLAAAKAAMRSQMSLDGQDFLNLEPKFICVGAAKEVEALQILSAQMLATKSGDVNVFMNSMKPIVEPRLTGLQWYLAASSDQVDTIEIAYLEGMSGPELTSQPCFDSDGVKLKIKHVVGVKAIDYRGLYKNPGA